MQLGMNIVNDEHPFAGFFRALGPNRRKPGSSDGAGARDVFDPATKRNRIGELRLLGGLTAVLLLAAPPTRAEELCVPASAEAVVTCLAEAFEHRNIEQLDALFTPDFIYAQGEETLDRATQLQSYEKMFKSTQVKNIAFSVEGVASEPKGETWLVTVAATKLVMSVERDGKKQDFTVHSSGYRFFIRPAADTYQIFRWEEPSTP